MEGGIHHDLEFASSRVWSEASCRRLALRVGVYDGTLRTIRKGPTWTRLWKSKDHHNARNGLAPLVSDQSDWFDTFASFDVVGTRLPADNLYLNRRGAHSLLILSQKPARPYQTYRDPHR